MTDHDDKVRLRHMLDHAQEAISMVGERERQDLGQDRMLELALVRLIEIIGEAAARISLESRTDHPSIPWPEIIGMRNRLIHGYDDVDLDVLWDTIELDLPPLVRALQQILESE